MEMANREEKPFPWKFNMMSRGLAVTESLQHNLQRVHFGTVGANPHNSNWL